MPEAEYAALPPDVAEFVDAWVTCLGNVLEQIGVKPSPCTALIQAPPELPAAAEGDLSLICGSSGGVRGEISLRIPPGAILLLAQALMGEEASAATDVREEHREAALEFMRQVAGHVSTALKPRWGEVHLRVEVAATPPWPPSASVWLCASRDSASNALVEMHLSAALVAALRAEKSQPATPPAAEASTPPIPADPKVNLDLLMDVGLGVTLRFGGRHLLLREVLDLSPGAVLELDRQVEESVDMLLDGRLVARGEVVVLEGNYALRVTEVAPGHNS